MEVEKNGGALYPVLEARGIASVKLHWQYSTMHARQCFKIKFIQNQRKLKR